MRTVKLFLYGFLGLLIVLFVIQNYATLTYSVSLRINLGFFALESLPLPFFVIIPALFFSGVLLGTLMGWFNRRRLSRELKQVKTSRVETVEPIKPDGGLSSYLTPQNITREESSDRKS